MKELQQLAEIIARRRLKKIEILNNSVPKPGSKQRQSQPSKAYHALIGGKLGSDEEAARYLGYDGVGSGYNSVKHRLKDMLINMVFFLHVDLSDRADAMYQCSRLRHVVSILLLLGGRNTAVEFAIKMLGIAEKFDLADYKLFCHKTLREHYAYIGDAPRYQKHNLLYSQARDQMLAEDKAEDFYNQIKIHYTRSIAQQPELHKDAFRFADEIAEDIKTHDTPVLQYWYHKLRGLGHQIGGEYEKSNEIWTAWETYLQKHPLFASNKYFGEAAMQHLDNYAYMLQYDEAKKCMDTCLKYFREDSRNRLIFLENCFLLAMTCGEYLDARKIFNLATGDKRLHTMPDTNREKWIIFGTYLFYAETGEEKGKQKKSLFDLKGFLKEVHVYKEDKAGFNISKLIIQISLLIWMESENEIIEKMDALKLYKKRYLKTEISYRVSVFMDLLFALDKSNYTLDKMKETEAILLEKLKEKPKVHTRKIDGMEVIPFERHWEKLKKDVIVWKRG